MWHKPCRTVTLDAHASRPVACLFSVMSLSKWRSYWICRYLDSVGHMFSAAQLEFAMEFQFQISCACGDHGQKLIDLDGCHFQNGRMVAWRSYWIFRFLDPNFSSALDIKSKLQLVAHYQYVWVKACEFSAMSLSKWLPGGHIGYFGFWTLNLVWLWTSVPNFSSKFAVYIGR